MAKTLVKPRTKVKPKTERPKLYKVILLNDDYTPREFVVQVLKAVFRMNETQAYAVMLTAHRRASFGPRRHGRLSRRRRRTLRGPARAHDAAARHVRRRRPARLHPVRHPHRREPGAPGTMAAPEPRAVLLGTLGACGAHRVSELRPPPRRGRIRFADPPTCSRSPPSAHAAPSRSGTRRRTSC